MLEAPAQNFIITTEPHDEDDASKIHQLYQDLYVTDMKVERGELKGDLNKEKVKNIELTQ